MLRVTVSPTPPVAALGVMVIAAGLGAGAATQWTTGLVALLAVVVRNPDVLPETSAYVHGAGSAQVSIATVSSPATVPVYENVASPEPSVVTSCWIECAPDTAKCTTAGSSMLETCAW